MFTKFALLIVVLTASHIQEPNVQLTGLFGQQKVCMFKPHLSMIS